MKNNRLLIVLVVFFAILSFWPGITSLPAMDRDESRFAQASRQMLESGDFIDIRFQETPRYKKPAGIYWMQSAATALAGGESPSNPIGTYRIPSFLAAILSILLTFLLSMKMTGSREKSLLAALMLCSSLILGAEARLAKTDATLLALTLAAMLGLWQTKENPAKRWIFLFWGAMGLGILVKGPVILIPILAVLLLDGTPGIFRKTRPGWGILLAALIILPWLAAITLSSGGLFWQESVGADMLAKTASAKESHGAPPGTYLLLLPFCLWAAFLPLAMGAPDILRRRKEPAIRFLLAWVLPFWLLFEIIPTKLVHYVLPTYPALAILAVIAIPTASRKVRSACLAIWSLAGFGLAALPVVLPLHFDGRILPASILASVTILAAMGGAIIPALGNKPIPLARTATLASMATALLMGFILPQLVMPFPSRTLAETAANLSPPMSRMVLVGYHEPSAVITMGTQTVLAKDTEAAAEILAKDPHAVAAIPANEADALRTVLPDAAFLGTIHGFNYSKGKPLTLVLARKGQP